MVDKSRIILVFCLLHLFMRAFAEAEYPLTNTIRDLHTELQQDSTHIAKVRQLDSIIAKQHLKMIDVVKKTDKLSVPLYTQQREMTFDMSYALKKVTAEYKEFSNDRRPYDRIVSNLDF